MVAGERDRPDVARRRAQWIKYQDRVDPARLVFIDETWTRTNMAPLRGWAPRGSRLIGRVPDGRWRTMTFLAALRHDRIASRTRMPSSASALTPNRCKLRRNERASNVRQANARSSHQFLLIGLSHCCPKCPTESWDTWDRHLSYDGRQQ